MDLLSELCMQVESKGDHQASKWKFPQITGPSTTPPVGLLLQGHPQRDPQLMETAKY